MQKVESSSLFSRFIKVLQMGTFWILAGGAGEDFLLWFPFGFAFGLGVDRCRPVRDVRKLRDSGRREDANLGTN